MGLAAINAELNKKYSKRNPDLVFDPSREIEYVSSANIIYDLTCGGFPKKRITEIISAEHMGKTSLLMAACAELQKKGGTAVYFDIEAAFDPHYAEYAYGLKVDMDTFSLYQPDTLEECSDTFDDLMEKCEEMGISIDLVCFDSIAMMKPKALIELSAEDSAAVALQARGVGRLFDKVKVACRRHNFSAVFTNQFRTAIKTNMFQQASTFYAGGVNEQFTTPGGQAPRYYSSVRVKLDYGGRDDDKTAEDKISGEVGKARTGKLVKIVNIKNRLGRPELMGVTHFVYPDPDLGIRGGWSKGLDMMEILKRRGRLYQKGTKLVYNGLEIPEWSTLGSAVSCQEKFMSDHKVMADAEKLVWSLCKGCKMGEASDMERARIGVDYDSSDTEGQERPPEDEIPVKSSKGKGAKSQPSDSGEIRTLTL